MKSGIMKFLPIVFGLGLGYLLTGVDFSRFGLGGWGPLLVPAAVLVVFLLFVAFLVTQSLPREAGMTPLDALPADERMQVYLSTLQLCGFVPDGPALRVEVNPAATAVPLVHGTEPVYALVFRTGTLPAVVGVDLFSILDDDRGGLTTNPDRRGGTFPGDAGMFRQILPGAEVPALMEYHQQAMRFLESRGLRFGPARPERFPELFRKSVLRQRKVFFRSPLVNLFTVIWRSVTLQSPYLGPLAGQKGVEAQVERFRSTLGQLF